jgi:hypothetical protein
MDDFIPIPYLEYKGTLCFLPFLHEKLGLIKALSKPTKQQSTQTEPPTKEVSTQTKKQPGLLWGYFG